jgi:hypothetical protein
MAGSSNRDVDIVELEAVTAESYSDPRIEQEQGQPQPTDPPTSLGGSSPPPQSREEELRTQQDGSFSSPELNNQSIPKYKSYSEYVRSLIDQSPAYVSLYDTLEGPRNDWGVGCFALLVVDVMENGKTNVQRFAFTYNPTESTVYNFHRLQKFQRIIKPSLSEPVPRQLRTRVIVLEIPDRRERGCRAIVGEIGLLYDIDPSLYAAFFAADTSSGTTFGNTRRLPLQRHPRFIRLHGSMVAQVMPHNHSDGTQYSMGKVRIVPSRFRCIG